MLPDDGWTKRMTDNFLMRQYETCNIFIGNLVRMYSGMLMGDQWQGNSYMTAVTEPRQATMVLTVTVTSLTGPEVLLSDF